MGIVNNGAIYTSPTTAAHLRSVLGTVNNQLSGITEELVEIVTRIEVLEGFVGLHAATFDATTVEGQAVYIKSTGNTGLAEADNATNSKAIGLAYDDVTAGATGFVLTTGHLTVADWTSVIGSASLTPGAIYFLSATAGQMTTTPPTSGRVVRMGIALTAQTFNIDIKAGIFLS